MPPEVMITASFAISIVMEVADEAHAHHVLMIAVAIVGKRLDADATTRVEQADDLQILGVHQLDQVLHDDVHAILMEIAVVAETEEVQLQALALDHAHARDIIDDDVAKVGLTRLGAQRSELGAVESHHIFVLGVLVLKGFQHVGTIIELILRTLVAEQRYTL